MYIAKNDRKIQPRPVLSGDRNLRPWPKRHLEASTTSPRPLKRRKTAPSSRDGPHILHSYTLPPTSSPPYSDAELSSDGYDSESSSTQSDETDEEKHMLSESDEFLLGAADTREETFGHNPSGSNTEGNDAVAINSSLRLTNSQPETASAGTTESEDDPSRNAGKRFVERRNSNTLLDF